jgi:Gas vesicle protein
MSDEGGHLRTEREVALVEILDRALGAGVVLTGDVTLSLADVDLVYVNLRILVASVATIRGERDGDATTEADTFTASVRNAR